MNGLHFPQILETKMKYFMGAYASSPNVGDWDPALETDHSLRLLTSKRVSRPQVQRAFFI